MFDFQTLSFLFKQRHSNVLHSYRTVSEEIMSIEMYVHSVSATSALTLVAHL
jgi:hypothetical protein